MRIPARGCQRAKGRLANSNSAAFVTAMPPALGTIKAKFPQGVFRRPVAINGPREELLGENEVKVVQCRFRLHPAIVASRPVRLLALVDHLLRLQPNLIADAVRESVAVDHHGLGLRCPLGWR